MSDIDNELGQQLIQGAKQMGVALDAHRCDLLLGYIKEFHKWNKAYNLSAVRDLQQMVSRHLLDSLSVMPWFEGPGATGLENLIDVGTGGGLPGIPLAIMFPQKSFTLLDSNGKKTRFLFHVKNLLGLDNVTVENRRVEEFRPAQLYDAVISRAFASLQDMTQGCAHLLAQSGVFLAMKGIFPQDELEPIAAHIRLAETIRLNVADTDGERHLLVLQPKL